MDRTPSPHLLGKKGASINGTGIRVNHTLGVRALHNSVPIYGDIVRLIYAYQHTTKSALFLQVQVRPLIKEAQNCAVVGPLGPRHVFLEALTHLTHQILFVKHPTRQNLSYMALKIHATAQQWT
jgi:hypothetical protein